MNGFLYERCRALCNENRRKTLGTTFWKFERVWLLRTDWQELFCSVSSAQRALNLVNRIFSWHLPPFVVIEALPILSGAGTAFARCTLTHLWGSQKASMQSATSSEPAQKSDPLTAFHDGQRLAGKMIEQ